MKDQEKLFELARRIFCDVEPNGYADAVYLFGQTSDNEDSVLDIGAWLWHQRKAERIGMCGGEARTGYPGFIKWQEKLLDQGIREESIVSIMVPPEINLNTLTEANALVEYAKEHKWESVYITASPFHQLRAFLTTVSVLLRSYPALKVYSKPGRMLPWNELVRHSQGTTVGTRKELLLGELERIQRYQKKGDIVSFDEVFSYLGERD